ncbi:MAG: hypothetical protein AB1521_04055 [Bacteroidota bacterium]
MKLCVVLLLTSLLFLSCSDEQIINPTIFLIDEATIGVKSKTYYPSLESSQILSIEDFEYKDGLLHKKIYYSENRTMIFHYELFNYGGDGKLSYKLNYHNNINSPTGFILLDSTVYFYSNNLLVTEKKIHPAGEYYVKYNYEYRDKYLIKKSKYRNEELDSYIIYEYEHNKIHREINYHKDNSITESKEYRYNNNALAEVVYYSFGKEAKRRIIYSYNEFGKLILEKVDELCICSSSLPYIVKYEY